MNRRYVIDEFSSTRKEWKNKLNKKSLISPMNLVDSWTFMVLVIQSLKFKVIFFRESN